MMYVQIYPLYGLVFGVNYWNADFEMDDDNPRDEDQTQNTIQVFFGIIGLSFHW